MRTPLEVGDCDALDDSAVEAGAIYASPPTDQPHGARSATVTASEIDAAYADFTVVESRAGSDIVSGDHASVESGIEPDCTRYLRDDRHSVVT